MSIEINYYGSKGSVLISDLKGKNDEKLPKETCCRKKKKRRHKLKSRGLKYNRLLSPPSPRPG